jgi:CheY-like chemotaxis protein
VRIGKAANSTGKIRKIKYWRSVCRADRLGRKREPRKQFVRDFLPVPRILVVDDEPLVSMLVENWLVELGCEVVGPARSVEQGLDFVGSAELDGAILDVNLGGNNSYALAEALKRRGVPFAFATGDSMIDAESGFPDPILLSKPFDFEGVKTVLGRLLTTTAG